LGSNLDEIAVDDVLADGGPIEVDLGVGSRQVGVEVDPYSAETPEVVEGAARLELAKHQLEVGLKRTEVRK